MRIPENLYVVFLNQIFLNVCSDDGKKAGCSLYGIL